MRSSTEPTGSGSAAGADSIDMSIRMASGSMVLKSTGFWLIWSSRVWISVTTGT